MFNSGEPKIVNTLIRKVVCGMCHELNCLIDDVQEAQGRMNDQDRLLTKQVLRVARNVVRNTYGRPPAENEDV